LVDVSRPTPRGETPLGYGLSVDGSTAVLIAPGTHGNAVESFRFEFQDPDDGSILVLESEHVYFFVDNDTSYVFHPVKKADKEPTVVAIVNLSGGTKVHFQWLE
jgi:hypothetical protein